jgi:hypothetical protein
MTKLFVEQGSRKHFARPEITEPKQSFVLFKVSPYMQIIQNKSNRGYFFPNRITFHHFSAFVTHSNLVVYD